MGDLLRRQDKGAITLSDVTKRYGGERVVNSISVDIKPGEFFSLLGPSGSGKTTTLMMIAGFTNPDEGRILVDGLDILRTPPQRRGFGMVFQNYAVFPHLNVFDNIAFPLQARKLPKAEVRQRVQQALELVRLERYATRFARQLSGGQQQRVAIARAIVFHPNVVLMDEPLGALDKNLRYQMQMEIKEIQRQLKMTVVYVTHDQEEAMNMSDRIAIMNNGGIEQIGHATEVYESPASSFVAKFLGEANLIEGVVESIAGDDVTLRTREGHLFRARGGENLKVSSQAHLFIRPEKIAIGEKGLIRDGSVNHISACVQRKSFLGNILRYSLLIGKETKVMVDVQNSRKEMWDADNEATLSWQFEDGKILPK